MCLEQSAGHNEEERVEERKEFLMRSNNIYNIHRVDQMRSNRGV
jgi:hypothetical protein